MTGKDKTLQDLVLKMRDYYNFQFQRKYWVRSLFMRSKSADISAHWFYPTMMEHAKICLDNSIPVGTYIQAQFYEAEEPADRDTLPPSFVLNKMSLTRYRKYIHDLRVTNPHNWEQVIEARNDNLLVCVEKWVNAAHHSLRIKLKGNPVKAEAEDLYLSLLNSKVKSKKGGYKAFQIEPWLALYFYDKLNSVHKQILESDELTDQQQDLVKKYTDDLGNLKIHNLERARKALDEITALQQVWSELGKELGYLE